MADDMPDILLVMTDQQRADFTRGEGFPLDTMPFLDGVADRGARFANAYTTSPACVPARTSLLTGRFPSSHRVRQNSTEDHAFYESDLLDVLRSAGYRLHFAGKPHMYRGTADFDDYRAPYMHEYGPRRRDEPDGRRFDEWLYELDHGVAHEPTPFPLEVQHPYRIVSDALQALDGVPDDQPLFLWASFPEPHNPYQVPEPYFSMFPESEIPERGIGPEGSWIKSGAYAWLQELVESKRPGYDAEWRRYRANYCGMLRLLDDQIRRLYEALVSRRGRETLVVFVSDHGDYAGDYGLQRKGAGMPECLMRIPFVMSGAGIAPRHRTEFVSIADVMPTVCELVSQPIPRGVQGRSLLPLLSGERTGSEEFNSIYCESGFGGLPYGRNEHPPLHFDYAGPTFDELNTVTQSGQLKMVRQGRFKLILDSVGRGELYDLEQDPYELNNLYADRDHAQQRAELRDVLIEWMLRLTDVLPQGNYTPKLPPHNWHSLGRAEALAETPDAALGISPEQDSETHPLRPTPDEEN